MTFEKHQERNIDPVPISMHMISICWFRIDDINNMDPRHAAWCSLCGVNIGLSYRPAAEGLIVRTFGGVKYM